LQDAVITLHGHLTPKFKYIQELREINRKLKEKHNFQPKKALKKVSSYSAIKLQGHLFDTNAINKILDYLEG
jgi:alpha-aminoadipic semialdehyde synthase